jgi:hypothetical protein
VKKNGRDRPLRLELKFLQSLSRIRCFANRSWLRLLRFVLTLRSYEHERARLSRTLCRFDSVNVLYLCFFFLFFFLSENARCERGNSEARRATPLSSNRPSSFTECVRAPNSGRLLRLYLHLTEFTIFVVNGTLSALADYTEHDGMSHARVAYLLRKRLASALRAALIYDHHVLVARNKKKERE